MEKKITDEELTEFTNVVADAIKGHPDSGFITTVALRLGIDVYNELQTWKKNPEGFYATVAQQTHKVLSTWKSNQTKPGGPVVDLGFLIQEFDQKLSSEKST